MKSWRLAPVGDHLDDLQSEQSEAQYVNVRYSADSGTKADIADVRVGAKAELFALVQKNGGLAGAKA